MANINLIYRKTILKTTYRASKVFDEVMDYETYKKDILGNKDNNFKYFNYLKGLYKAKHFILNTNIKKYNPLVINILYNLIFSKNLSKENQINIFNIKVDTNSTIDSIIKMISSLNIKEKNDKYIFSYIIIVYLIYINIKEMYNFSNHFFQKFYEIITKTKEYKSIKDILEIEFKKIMFPDRSYFDTLKEIKPIEIINFLKEKQDYIKENFKITSLYLYGSFIKGSYRIDSDIDIAGVFVDDISYKEKENLAMNIKEYILKKFNRYCDFMEYSETILKDEKHIKLF